MNPTPEQIKLLPQWARDYINVLELDIFSLKEELARTPGVARTNVAVGKYPDYRYLPDDERISFCLDDENTTDIQASLIPSPRWGVRCVEIAGLDVLRIEPQTQHIVRIFSKG